MKRMTISFFEIMPNSDPQTRKYLVTHEHRHAIDALPRIRQVKDERPAMA